MTDRTKELLAVLDMPEEELWEWGLKNTPFPICCLADLAFRMRDEVNGAKLLEGQRDVFLARHYQQEYWDDFRETTSFAEPERWFGSQNSRPIDWIIAALIAKALSKD